MRILDMLLLPRRIYQTLTDRKPPLYIGILFIGLADLVLPYLKENYTRFFIDKPAGILIYNIVLTIAFIIIIGVVDVLFFTIPLFDIFKVFKKEKDEPDKGDLRIRLAKIYVIAHVIIVPVNIILYFLFNNLNGSSNTLLIEVVAYITLLVWLWFSAIISRGINSIYNFHPLFRRLVFLLVFLWNLLMGSALEYMLRNWVMALFR